MDTHQPVTRRRIITSCSNCHRRKQKCNRRRPCNNCTMRNVGHECFYDTLSWNLSSGREASTLPAKAEEARQSFMSVLETAPTSTARDAFGYSATEDSNAFIDASKVIQNSNNSVGEKVNQSSAPQAWQKYWHYISKLPSGSLLNDLIDTYISDVHWVYGIIEIQYFTRNLEEWRLFTSSASGSASVDAISAELRSFPAMLYQLMATSLLYLPPGSPIHRSLEATALQTSQQYSDAGFELARLLGCQSTSINGVLHDLLRAAWLKNRGRGAEAWHALNSSIRNAQDLNLHRQSKPLYDPSKEDFWQREWKRRVWTTLYMWDSNMSLLLGRPRLINASDCDIEPPLDCDIPSNLERVQLSSIQAYISQPNRIPSTVCMNRYMYLLAHKMNEFRSSGADKKDLTDYSIIQRLHYEILSLLEDLPPIFRPSILDTTWDAQMPVLPRQRDKIYTCAHSLLMALHRPHVAKHMESRQRAQEAALNVLDSQQRFFEAINAHHYGYFGNAFFSIDACIILSTIVTVYPCQDTELLQRVLLAIQQAMGRLGLLEAQNELAPFGLKIVRSCYQMVKEKYEDCKKILSTVSPDWPASTGTASSADTSSSYQSFDFIQPTSHVPSNTGLLGLDIGISEQSNVSLFDSIATGGNEFDTAFWMGYRQQVFDDAIAGNLAVGNVHQGLEQGVPYSS